MIDPQRWNAACDIMIEILQRPDPDHRGLIRDEKCCDELEIVKNHLLKELEALRM